MGISYRTAKQCHLSTRLQHAISICTTIDSIFHATAFHTDDCVTEVLSCDITRLCLLAKTATEDATIHSTTIDIYMGSLVRCRGVSRNISIAILYACRIHCTKGTTTIDTAIHSTRTTKGTLATLGTDVHYYVTTDNSRLTFTATIDVSHRTVKDVYIHVTRSITRLTTAIDITTILIRIITNNSISVNGQRDSTCNSAKGCQVFCCIENVIVFVNPTITCLFRPCVAYWFISVIILILHTSTVNTRLFIIIRLCFKTDSINHYSRQRSRVTSTKHIAFHSTVGKR